MLTLLILPGLDGTGMLLSPIVKALEKDYAVRLVRYPPTGAFGYDDLEFIARALIPDDRPFIILAESFSGPIAISIAASRPNGLLGLILCCTFARTPRPRLAFLRHVTGLLPISLDLLYLFDRLLIGRQPPLWLRHALITSVHQVTSASLRARIQAVLSVDVSDKLASLNIPLLYLRAAHDKVVPPSAGDWIRTLRPDAGLITIDAPHCLLQIAPQAAATAIRDFVRKHDLCLFPDAPETQLATTIAPPLPAHG